MIVLGIDTSGTGCAAALYDSQTDTVLGAAGEDIGRGLAERLMEFVDGALAAAGLDLPSIDRIVGLAEASRALTAMQRGELRGQAVICP